MRIAPTNAELKRVLGRDVICSLVFRRLMLLLDSDTRSHMESTDPLYWVELDLCDPVRIFVKNELHSSEKAASGRMRLISSVSCIDQMVERVLCGDQNEAEIAVWSTIPSKPGLSLADEGLTLLVGNLQDFDHAVETDVSGWDWSVKQWMLDADALCRTLLAEQDVGGVYHRALSNRMRLLGQAVLVLSDGHVWIQRTPGIMKSGSYLTSSSNSRMRVLVGYAAGAAKIMANGDDAVEEAAENASEEYRAYGLLVKEYKEVSLHGDGIEFCSVLFRPQVEQCVYKRHGKLLGGLLQKTPRDALHEAELLAGLRFELRHSDKLDAILDLITQSGWGLRKDGEESSSQAPEAGAAAEEICCC